MSVSDPDPYAVLLEACRRLKLKPRETTLMRDCLWARSVVPNGHYLIQPTRIPAARRLIVRGYLAEADRSGDQPMPLSFGLVIVAEADHLNKLIMDADAAIGASKPEADGVESNQQRKASA